MSESTSKNEKAVTITQEGEVHDKLSLDNKKIPPPVTSNVSIDSKKAFPTSGRFIQIIDISKALNNQNNVQNVELSPKVTHLLDATIEDPFTLETFETLIQQHAEKDKDFILARVTTADPSDNSKIYNSYYSGHQINKVLFRTQPEQGLLHRMKAKNPLNNMNIIGDVYYYVVKAETVKPIQSSIPPFGVQNKTSLLKNGGLMTEIHATSALDTNEGDYLINIDPDKIIYRDDGLNSSPPSIWQGDRAVNDSKDSIIIKTEERRRSANDLIKLPPKLFHPDNFHFKKHSSNNSLSSSQNTVPIMQPQFPITTSSHLNDVTTVSSSTFEIFKIPNSTYKFEHTKYNVPYNFYNQNLDSISPSNSINLNEKGNLNQVYYYQAIFYAIDDDFLMKSSVRQYFKLNALDPSDTQLFIINTSQNAHATGALNSTPPSTQLERIIANNGTFIDDSTTNSRNGSHTGGSRWARQLRSIRSNKGLKWLVLMYMVFGFLLIRFVVSEAYAYLMAFLLMLCLFLVFCVGSGIGIWGR
ncbi:22534_t:CDS:2 [Cetraspora pellucida]|uniref:22534_t:CDS:1 n=1 Tax=Cetraspora pellucida TaxID=1433469 RepID=A0A9N9EIF4_9GLOM|nr:22534_t:CDS:2 [Cetraspora pellucida]